MGNLNINSNIMDKEQELTQIQMLPIKSSRIKRLGCSIKDRELFIEFKGRRVYRYNYVSRDIIRALFVAESKGKFFEKEIKNIFTFDEITDLIVEWDKGYISFVESKSDSTR